jgi:hypothetical protein
MENEELREEFEIMQRELSATRAVLGTLIGCLASELGMQGANRLLERLSLD